MKKLFKSLPFIFSIVLFIIGFLIIYFWASSYNSWTLREQLKTLSPLFLEINFFLIVIALVVTVKQCCTLTRIKTFFGDIPRTVWLYLGCISVLGLILVVFIVPREHRIYYDEDIYQNIGQNIAYTKGAGSHYGETFPESLTGLWKRIIGRAGMCNEGKNEYGEYACYRLEYNKEPNGWAYLLSVVYRLFGVHEVVSFLTNNVVFFLSIITVFFLGVMLFGHYPAGLYAALIFALTPEALIWSNTVAVEPSAAFMPACATLCVFFFLKARTLSTFFLSVAVTAFAVQFRPEAIMITAVIALIFLFRGRDELTKGTFYLMASFFLLLIVPHVIHLYSVKNLGWGSSGPKFSFDYLGGNFKVNFLFYLRNMRFPAVFSIFFLLGICLKDQKKASFLLKEKLIACLWFLLFWGIFVFFYAGSYNYGADVRFSLLSFIPFSLIAGYGASQFVSLVKKKRHSDMVGCIVTLVIITSFLSFLPFVRAVTQEAWAARADHRFGRQMVEALPQDSVVLTHNPNMFLLWGKNAAQASLVTEQRGYADNFFNRYKGGVYFHYNFWCNVNDKQQNAFCENILDRFDCSEIMSFEEKDYTFSLYKVERKERE